MRDGLPQIVGHLDVVATRAVDELFQAAAAGIRTRLVNRIGSNLPVRPLPTEWLPLSGAVERLAPSAATASFRLQPGLVGLVSVELGLLARLVGQMLGQPPIFAAQSDPFFVLAPDRPLSRFDRTVAGRIAEDVLGGLVESLALTTAAEITGIGSSSRIVMPVAATALVGVVSYEIGTPEQPYGMITLVTSSEITRIGAPRAVARTSGEGRLGIERVLPLPVTAVVELRRMSLPLARVRALEVGQVIDLGAVRDVVVRVGDRPTLLGEAGSQNSVRSVRIKSRVEGGFVR
jgi:flagellar motor switch protein FliM